MFLDIIEPDDGHSVVTEACEGHSYCLMSLWQEDLGEKLRTTALLGFDRPERFGNLRPFETELPGLCLGDARAQDLDRIPPIVAHVLGSRIGAEDLLGPAGELTQHDGIGA